MQPKGIYLFETYVPVVQWTSVNLMLVIEVIFTIEIKAGLYHS